MSNRLLLLVGILLLLLLLLVLLLVDVDVVDFVGAGNTFQGIRTRTRISIISRHWINIECGNKTRINH